MQDMGYRIPDTGYGTQDTGCLNQDILSKYHRSHIAHLKSRSNIPDQNIFLRKIYRNQIIHDLTKNE